MAAAWKALVLALIAAATETEGHALQRPLMAAHVQLQSVRPHANATSAWEHHAPEPSLTIVTGGTPDIYGPDNYGSKTAAILTEYARRHNYGLYVERNMSRLSGRRKGWNKIRLLQEFMGRAPIVAWFDADIVLRNLSIPLHDVLHTCVCDAAEQQRWEPYFPRNASAETFIWMSGDLTPRRYLVNVNTGVIVIRNTDVAREFLDQVWGVDDMTLHSEHKADPWAWAATGEDDPDYGWPWEQGAIWNVLASNPDKYMRRACAAPVGTLQSVRSFNWTPGQFSQHCSGMSPYARTKVARSALMELGI